MPLSKRIRSVPASQTAAVAAKAMELKRQGLDIINMGVGEPDFDTPEHIKQAGIEAINKNQTRYTAIDGTPELKAAVIEKLNRDNQLNYQPDQILTSAGAKHSLFNAFIALLDAGDEVIIPAPYWVSYPAMVQLFDAQPIIINAPKEQHFKITAKQLETAITSKTKAIILNSPTNPTGMVYSKNELKSLADVLLKYPNIIILSDDIYEHISWADQPYHNIVNAEPKLYNRTLVINGVSKAYAMTGWRMGFAAGPKNIIAAMKKVQSQSTSSICSITQAAAKEAFVGDQSCLTPMIEAFKARHDTFIQGLNQIPGFHCLNAEGAFYAFVDVQEAIQKTNLKDDIALASYILEKALVAAVPGTAFGAPGHLRFSYACSIEQINEVLERLKKLFA